MRRKYVIVAGDTSWTNCKSEWDVFLQDSISNIGHHSNTCSAPNTDPDLNITLANGTVIGNNFEFDIMVSSTINNTYLNDVSLDFTYNPLTFGTQIVTNNRINATLGANFNSNTFQDPDSLIFDFGSSDTVDITFQPKDYAGTWNRYLLTSTPVVLLHLSMQISNCNHSTNIQFINQTFDAQFDNYVANANTDPNNILNDSSYTAVTYGGALNTSIPPCAINPQITSFIGGYDGAHSVIAGADYTQMPSGESLLTINGSNFGTIKGTVYMTNAVNNSPPIYVSLDNYDFITSWTNNQINILVPSVLFGNDSLNYPGTGFIYVKPNGATDSVSSSTLGATNGTVIIPYILKNRSFSSGGIGTNKQRVPFSYRKFLSTTSFNADTSAYDFRFDVTTVTNNTQSNGGPNCRALLKQAIEDWACKIPIKYRIGRDTTITNPNPDGISYITFKPTLSNSTFGAETKVSVNPCSGYNYATEADVSFNSTVNWYYVSPSLVPNGTPNPNMQGGSFADFFTTALHEFGHVSLLLHVNQLSDLMYFKIPNTTGIGPYISSDDQAGGSDNLNWSKTLPLSGCPYNAFAIPSSGATTCVDPETGQVGIDQFNANTQLSIYPNPATDFINVAFTKQSESSNTIKLINTIGQTVFYSNIGKNEGAQEVINLQSISKGVYLLVVTDNGTTIAKKIIVE